MRGVRGCCGRVRGCERCEGAARATGASRAQAARAAVVRSRRLIDRAPRASACAHRARRCIAPHLSHVALAPRLARARTDRRALASPACAAVLAQRRRIDRGLMAQLEAAVAQGTPEALTPLLAADRDAAVGRRNSRHRGWRPAPHASCVKERERVDLRRRRDSASCSRRSSRPGAAGPARHLAGGRARGGRRLAHRELKTLGFDRGLYRLQLDTDAPVQGDEPPRHGGGSRAGAPAAATSSSPTCPAARPPSSSSAAAR